MITGINHITFAVSDLNRSLKFYQQLLGFQLIVTWDKGAYLLAGNLWVCLSIDKNVRKAPAPDYTHIAFSVASKHFADLAAKIKQADIPVWKENTSEGDSIYILDPDNHKLEIHAADLKSRIEHLKKEPYSGLEWHR